MRRIITAIALVWAFIPAMALAVDLDALSGQSKRDACAAYIWADLNIRRDAGQVSQQAFSNEQTRLMFKVYASKGYSFTPGRAAAVDRYLEAISADNPTATGVATQAAVCRAYLKL